jgi:hypothetical protein
MIAVSKQPLLEELSEHNVFFDMIVDMIPSELSNAGNLGGDFNPSKSKVVHDIQRSKESTGKGKGLQKAQAGSFAKRNDGRSKISSQEIEERQCDDSASSEENFFESGQDISANQGATTTTTTPVNPKQSRILGDETRGEKADAHWRMYPSEYIARASTI